MEAAGKILRQNTAGHSAGSPGFSVLEAIIAIAILAVAFLPLLTLQEQMTRTTINLERNEELMEIKRSALAYLRNINPMQHPNGELDLGQANMHWKATPLSEERAVIGLGGSEGRFIIALYDVKVTLVFDEQRTREFSIHATGWRAKAPFLSDL